jgi:hypothetical protein
MQAFAVALEQLRAEVLAGRPPLESAPAASPQLGVDALYIADDVIADPVAYTARVRAATFASVPIGPVTFHGIAPCMDPELANWITARFPLATPRVTFFRQSPEGQKEPNLIHTDRDMGDWSGILYLTEQPIKGDGTTFWRDRRTHATASTATTPEEFLEEWAAWGQREQWDTWVRVNAKPNRLVLFPAPLFHSRSIAENYGEGADARLIQVIFGTGTLDRAPVRTP